MARGEESMRIKEVCETHNLAYGIFWEDRSGVVSVASFYSDEEKVKLLKSKGAPVYTEWSTQVTFAAGEGAPGRTLSNGRYEWCPDVQSLSKETFVRWDAAKASNIKTVICVAVKGGVMELGSHLKIKEDASMIKAIKLAFSH